MADKNKYYTINSLAKMQILGIRSRITWGKILEKYKDKIHIDTTVHGGKLLPESQLEILKTLLNK